MIGSSPRMIEIYKTISLVAPTNATVLIEGETGNRQGNDRAHDPQQQSARAAAVRAGGLRVDRAIADRKRAVRRGQRAPTRAPTGTAWACSRRPITARSFWMKSAIWRLGFQLNLLRFLQEKEIRPLGSARGRKVDVRVIAATNRDLQKMVEDRKVSRRPVVPAERGPRYTAAAGGPPRRCSAAGALLLEEVQRALRPAGQADRIRVWR